MTGLGKEDGPRRYAGPVVICFIHSLQELFTLIASDPDLPISPQMFPTLGCHLDADSKFASRPAVTTICFFQAYNINSACGCDKC